MSFLDGIDYKTDIFVEDNKQIKQIDRTGRNMK
jgi:hypothetical protein